MKASCDAVGHSKVFARHLMVSLLFCCVSDAKNHSRIGLNKLSLSGTTNIFKQEKTRIPYFTVLF